MQGLHTHFFCRTISLQCPHLPLPNPKGAKLQNFTKAETKSSLSKSIPSNLLLPLSVNMQGSPHTRESLLDIGLLPLLKTYNFTNQSVFAPFWTQFWKSSNNHRAPNSSSLFLVKPSENLNSGNGQILSNYLPSYIINLENFFCKVIEFYAQVMSY